MTESWKENPLEVREEVVVSGDVVAALPADKGDVAAAAAAAAAAASSIGAATAVEPTLFAILPGVVGNTEVGNVEEVKDAISLVEEEA